GGGGTGGATTAGGGVNAEVPVPGAVALGRGGMRTMLMPKSETRLRRAFAGRAWGASARKGAACAGPGARSRMGPANAQVTRTARGMPPPAGNLGSQGAAIIALGC